MSRLSPCLDLKIFVVKLIFFWFCFAHDVVSDLVCIKGNNHAANCPVTRAQKTFRTQSQNISLKNFEVEPVTYLKDH